MNALPDLAAIIQQGVANPWVYLPVAVVLGALHALEPGHSKSLMAAFIIAIRGTPAQAVLLGASAAVGHTIIVFGLAALGLWFGDRLIAERAEPWLELASGLLVVALAARLLWSFRSGMGGMARSHHGSRQANGHAHVHAHPHDHTHPHDHDHHHAHHGHRHHGDEHHHDHHHHDAAGDEDAHAAAHARDIEARFAGRQHVSAGEIVWFGFTGGLLPCPAAIAVLLICLQLGAFTLGLGMVAAFSFGLAVTLVAVGLLAAWGTKRAAGRFGGDGRFARLARWMPLVSGGLVLLLGLAFVVRGVSGLLSA